MQNKLIITLKNNNNNELNKNKISIRLLADKHDFHWLLLPTYDTTPAYFVETVIAKYKSIKFRAFTVLISIGEKKWAFQISGK